MKYNETFCPCCRELKSAAREFTDGYGVQIGKNLNFCKECNNKKLEKYKTYLTPQGAFWVLCSENGIPYIQQVYDIAINLFEKSESANKNLLDVYVKKLKQLDKVYNGFWDSDKSLDELEHKNKNNQEISPTSDSIIMEKRWGRFDRPDEAYPFLEELFKDYTENILEMDTNLRNRYRDLCKAEYAKRKAEENGDMNEISKAQDNIFKLLKLLKLDDFKETSVDPREKFIDRLAWMIENEEPAEEEDREKYRDIAGFEKAFKEIMRSMRNLIGGTKEFPNIPKEER